MKKTLTLSLLLIVLLALIPSAAAQGSQPTRVEDPERVSIVGASLGMDLGVLAMAEDERVITLVGLSPLPEIMGEPTPPAVEAIGNRPLYFVAAQKVEGEMDAARQFVQVAQGAFQLRLYDTSACCTYLFMLEDDLAPSILNWLDIHAR
jgi:hypothetical protein